MAKTGPNSNAERYQNFQALLNQLSKNPNVFICAPDQSKPEKLRVYAHGGLLCKIPCKNVGGELILPDKDYVRNHFSEPNKRRKLSKLCDPRGKEDYFDQKSFSWPRGNDRKLKLLHEGLDYFLEMTEHWSEDNPERRVQTIISNNHRDYNKHNCVVFDFEHCIAEELFTPMKAGTASETKKPKFDMLLFSIENQKPVVTIVELKHTKAACTGTAGVVAHSIDMTAACNYSKEHNEYKIAVLNRLKTMIEYSLLSNVPVDVDKLLDNPKQVDLRKSFLFVKSKSLSRETSLYYCRKINPDYINEFDYQFANTAEDVDLSKMQSWEEFSTQAE